MLNRLAQRYLVNRVGGLPVVSIPGSDLDGTATWRLGPAGPPDTYHLSTSADPHLSLQCVGDKLTYGEEAPQHPAMGSWSLQDTNDGSGYCYLLSAYNNELALSVDTIANAVDEFPLALLPTKSRAAMWHLGDQCVADARSVHLRYQTPDRLVLFYNEVYPEDAPPGTFFCTSGFGANSQARAPSGYAGIQQQADGSRIVIFSVWHRMANEVDAVPGALATVVGAHPQALTTAFSGEGSGSSIRLPLLWEIGEAVRIVITAEPLGDDTVLSSFVATGEGPWVYLGAISRAETGGGLIGNTYAFIEDYARSGNTPGLVPAARSPYRSRSATFANPWYVAAPPRQQLAPAGAVTVTAYSPHLLENLTVEATSSCRFGLAVATGAGTAENAPPLGARFSDPTPDRRELPTLDGVPYPT